MHLVKIIYGRYISVNVRKASFSHFLAPVSGARPFDVCGRDADVCISLANFYFQTESGENWEPGPGQHKLAFSR